MEIWKAVNGYEGIYEVSNKGSVRSLPRVTCRGQKRNGKILKLVKWGMPSYLGVYLCKDGTEKRVLVHRLIAQTFIPNPNNKPEVNHIDGDRFNNTVENLEWATPKENVRHAYDTGLAAGLKGERNGCSKLTENQVLEIYERGNKGESQRSLAREFGVVQNTVGQILRGEKWNWLTKNRVV